MNPWEEPPAGKLDERRTRIERVPAGANWKVAVTGKRLAALRLHHTDGRTIPCLSVWGMVCRPCQVGNTFRREGYFSAFVINAGLSCVLAVPDRAIEQIEKLLPKRMMEARLQGAGLNFTRRGESRRAALSVEYFGECLPGLGPALDVPAILCRAWGMPALLERWRDMLRGDSAAG